MPARTLTRLSGQLHFLYTHNNAMGYGRMGVQLHKVFTELGLDVVDHLRPTDTPAPCALWASLSSNAQGWYAGQHLALLTMWEANELPENLREGLHNFAQVFVPSLANVDLFSRYHDDVTWVPLGVDPRTWDFREREEPSRTFRFLADGRGERKGTDMAVAAFKRAFPRQKRGPGPQPQLVLKGWDHNTNYVSPDIKTCQTRLSEGAEVDLYASAHCFLAPSRGEGWGLQPLQAMAQGCPTILTDAHGQEAFADLGYPVQARLAKANYRLFGESGQWWEPDLEQLIEHMRWVYDHYDQARGLARTSSAAVLDPETGFTWERTATTLVRDMRVDLKSRLSPGPWTRPTSRLFPLIVRMDWRCEVAGEMFYFKPGKLYHERGEIKRMLFEAGCLDPACMTMDGAETGLLAEQVERIGSMSAAHEACPTCGQQLNTKPLWEYEDAGSSGL